MFSPDDPPAVYGLECSPSEHAPRPYVEPSARAFRGAVSLFKALSDEQRLRTLEFLSQGEACASEIAAQFDEPLSTVSHRMKLLEQAGLVSRRRDGRHVHFSLLDHHVLNMVRDALDHAVE